MRRDYCGTCAANRGELRAPGGPIYDNDLWRLEHVLEPIPMAGWLVLKPRKHVTSFAELTPSAAEDFGSLLRRVIGAMQSVLSPNRVYVALFAEQEGFEHIHFHLIPRFADAPHELRGPAVFALLKSARAEGRDLASVTKAVEVASRIRDLLADE